MVSTRSRPKAADLFELAAITIYYVSTRSRPKAADQGEITAQPATQGFNTQPPEGG